VACGRSATPAVATPVGSAQEPAYYFSRDGPVPGEVASPSEPEGRRDRSREALWTVEKTAPILRQRMISDPAQVVMIRSQLIISKLIDMLMFAAVLGCRQEESK